MTEADGYYDCLWTGARAGLPLGPSTRQSAQLVSRSVPAECARTPASGSFLVTIRVLLLGS
jgi:hypothetical protein